MEIPRKHDKKKNIKTLKPAINVCAASGGLGVLLLGGALVTATIVSALAFRSRSQRRSSSETTKKEMSPSPETHSVDAPNTLELTMEPNTNFYPSEEGTSPKERQTENIQSLTPDKKHDELVHYRDSNEDTIDPALGEDQENTPIHVDSVCESEEQVVMAVQLEKYSCLEKDDDGGEERKHLMKNEIEEHDVDANSLESDEGIEEYEAVEAPLRDIGSEDDQETVVMNEKVVGAMEVEFLAEKENNNGHDEIILDDCEGDLSDETGYADHVELMEEEEEEKEACETLVVACVMNRLKEAVDDQTATSRTLTKEENGEETAEKVEEQVTMEDEAAKAEMVTEHELVKKDDVKEDGDSEEDVMEKVELTSGDSSSVMEEEPTPEAKISNNNIEETAVQVKAEMITDREVVKKDGSPHVEDSEDDVTVSFGVSASTMQEEPTPEGKSSNHKIEENMDENQTTLVKNHNDNGEAVTVKDELGFGVGNPSMKEEPTLEAKSNNHKVEENMEENQTILSKNHNDSEEDVTVKDELSSGISASSVHEELTPEAKISNHKIEENMEENQTILGKNHLDSDDDRVIKEQVFAREPWNLKLMAWSILISVWCLCHWYSELPFPELSLVGSLFFILILFAYRNRDTHLVKYE